MDLLIAAFLDVIFGDPYFLPHPVRLMGNIISLEEGFIRKHSKSNKVLKIGGGLIVLINIIIAISVPYFFLLLVKGQNIIYHIVNIYFLYTCIAAGCLHREAMKIYKALSVSIEEARLKLSYIVGRDTKNLTSNEIIRATVETVAENTSDGVIAPILYAIIGGAPLAFAYKMINTMDSMLGYMSEKYMNIGFFPAKTDDVFNYLPARITGVLMNLSSLFRYRGINGLKIMIRDRKNHKSPNCAYPEGAVAGLLEVQLGGDNVYFGELVKKPRIGDPVIPLEPRHIKNTIEIMYRAEVALLLIYGIVRIVL